MTGAVHKGSMWKSTNNSIYKMWFYKAKLPAFCVHNTCTILTSHIESSVVTEKPPSPPLAHQQPWEGGEQQGAGYRGQARGLSSGHIYTHACVPLVFWQTPLWPVQVLLWQARQVKPYSAQWVGGLAVTTQHYPQATGTLDTISLARTYTIALL